MSDRFPQLWIKSQTEKIIKDLEAYRWFRAKLDDRGCEFEYAKKERVMSDLISREDAIKQIEFHQNHEVINRMETKHALEMVKSSIEELPTAEPKVGKWLWDCAKYKCPFCGEVFEDFYPYEGAPNYCPNCGAKMERRADDNTD